MILQPRPLRRAGRTRCSSGCARSSREPIAHHRPPAQRRGEHRATRSCPTTATTRRRCCSAPTSRCTSRRPSGTGVVRYAATARPLRRGPARARRRAAARAHQRRARPALPAEARPARRHGARRRGADPLEPPAARPAAARRVPARRRADRADRPAHRLGARRARSSRSARGTPTACELSVAVNVSARNLAQPGVRRAGCCTRSRASGIAADRLILEITETALFTDVEKATGGARHGCAPPACGSASTTSARARPRSAFLSRLPVQRAQGRPRVRHRRCASTPVERGDRPLGRRARRTTSACASSPRAPRTRRPSTRCARSAATRVQGYTIARPMPADELLAWMRAPARR